MNSEEKKIYNKEYRSKNKEKQKAYKKAYYEKNKEKQKEYQKEKNKEYYSKNNRKEYHKEYNKEYRIKNKTKRNQYSKEYIKERKVSDPLYKLSCNIRSLIGKSLSNKGYKKKSRTHEILQLSFEDFKKYIEDQFEPWMTWENHGLYNGELNYGWDYDHIIPLSSATTEKEILELNKYSNLQPLCSYTNRDIKKDKVDFNI
jgi:hypothetical protein